MKTLEEKKEKMAKKMDKRRSEAKPVTSKDHELSIKHLKDSIKFQESHAKEHLEALKEDGYSSHFNKDHAKEHLKHLKEDKKLIKEREKSAKKC